MRRAALAGGTAEILARTGELGPHDPSLAVVGGRVFVTRLDRAALRRRGHQAAILRVERGAARPFARHPRGVASASLFAHDGALYWIAATPIGPGPIVATDARTGRTREVAPCRDAEVDWSELVPGTPPMAIAHSPGGDGQLHPLTPRVSARAGARPAASSRSSATWRCARPSGAAMVCRRR